MLYVYLIRLRFSKIDSYDIVTKSTQTPARAPEASFQQAEIWDF